MGRLPTLPNGDSFYLLDFALQHQLYEKLILQLNKDFCLANIALEFSTQLEANELKSRLEDMVYQLMRSDFSQYLNFLYIIDVSEDRIKELDGSDLGLLCQQVVWLVLYREWEKVWYRHVFDK